MLAVISVLYHTRAKELQDSYNAYNVEELKHLICVLSPILSALQSDSKFASMVDEDRFEIEILIEDILNFKNLVSY